MMLHVLEASGLVTIQDRGRFGWAHLGVPRAGALDAEAAALAQRIVGNDPDAALLELTVARLVFRLDAGRWCTVTGARCDVRLNGLAQANACAFYVGPGATVEVDRPAQGARAYLAVGGGIDVAPVLGSRSTDTLAGLGPPPVLAGAELPIGDGVADPHPHETPRPRGAGPVRLWPGPRVEWFGPEEFERLCRLTFTVSADSNRIGVRLRGEPLAQVRRDELPSEGIVLGSVQVPPDGQPVVLLHDHPVTGGYPVLAVVDERDLGVLAQVLPGDTISFARAR